MEKKKVTRMKANGEMKRIYSLILNYVKQRAKDLPTPIYPIQEERKLMDILKITSVGGWVIDEDEFYQLLSLTEIKSGSK